MKKKYLILLVTALLVLLLTACGGKDDTDYEHLRDVSWDGTELTITLGENKTTGCEWTTKPEDDSVIDYSVNRVFHLADSKAAEGESIGSLEAGFKGTGAGTSRVICTTPVGWDGIAPGLTYIVTVTVNEDGTIENAVGEESETPLLTVESYFSEHTDELEAMKEQLNQNEELKDAMTIDVYAEGNTVCYIYTLKQPLSQEQVEAAKPKLQEYIDTNQDSLKEQIASMEEGLGIDGVKLYFEYRNTDGTEIYSGTVE